MLSFSSKLNFKWYNKNIVWFITPNVIIVIKKRKWKYHLNYFFEVSYVLFVVFVTNLLFVENEINVKLCLHKNKCYYLLDRCSFFFFVCINKNIPRKFEFCPHWIPLNKLIELYWNVFWLRFNDVKYVFTEIRLRDSDRVCTSNPAGLYGRARPMMFCNRWYANRRPNVLDFFVTQLRFGFTISPPLPSANRRIRPGLLGRPN